MTSALRLILFDATDSSDAGGTVPDVTTGGAFLAADPSGDALMGDDGSGGGVFLQAD